MTTTADGATTELIPCEMPGGCANAMEYTGVGRKPRYCGRPVDGVAHTRYNAYRINKGLPASSSAARTEPPDPALPRSVSGARAGLEGLRDEIATTVAAHQEWMTDALGRFGATLATATDLDAAAAEVAAAHRDARARIDAADAAAEHAAARARAADTEATAARAAQASAEEAAEQALAQVDEATERAIAADDARRQLAERATELDAELAIRTVERDRLADELTRTGVERDEAARLLSDARATAHRLDAELVATRERFTTELADTRTELAVLAAERDRLAVDRDRATTERDRLTADLGAVRADAAEQRHRADTAEGERDRGAAAATAAQEELSTCLVRLHAAGERADQLAADLATVREQLAETRGRLDGAHDALAREKAHTAERLADQRATYESLLTASRFSDPST